MTIAARTLGGGVIDGTGVAAFVTQEGIGNLVDNGVGDYSIDLGQQMDESEGIILISIRTVGFSYQIVHIDDQTKQLLLFDAAGAAVDCVFAVIVIKFSFRS